MNRWERLVFGVALGMIGLAAGAGCTTTSTGDSTEDSTVEDVEAFIEVAEGDGLDQLTAGDVVAGFESFAASLPNVDEFVELGALTEDQVLEIEAAQERLNLGEITEEEFEMLVWEIIGDSAPGFAFAGFGAFGGPFGFSPGGLGLVHQGSLLEDLELTGEQLAEAQATFDTLHENIRSAREMAHDEFLALLTEEQLAELEGGQASQRFGRPAFAGGAGLGAAGPFGRLRFLGGGFNQFGSPQGERIPFGELLAEQLALDEAQQTALAAIRDQLRVDVKTLHEQAREDFLAILTPEQIEILEEIEGSDWLNEGDSDTKGLDQVQDDVGAVAAK